MSALAVIGIALVLVPACGGRYRRLERVRLNNEPLVLSLFVVQGVSRGWLVGSGGATSIWSVSLWAATSALLLGLLTRNSRRMGIPVIMLGLVSNLLVILLNDGMPASLLPRHLESAFYHPLSGQAILAFLADVLPAPRGALVSLGDVLLALGVVIFLLSSSMPPVSEIQEWDESR